MLVPVNEISTVVPWVMRSKRRRKDTSQSTPERQAPQLGHRSGEILDSPSRPGSVSSGRIPSILSGLLDRRERMSLLLKPAWPVKRSWREDGPAMALRSPWLALAEKKRVRIHDRRTRDHATPSPSGTTTTGITNSNRAERCIRTLRRGFLPARWRSVVCMTWCSSARVLNFS